MYNNLPLSHHAFTTQNSISAMAPPTNSHTNYSRPFDLSRSGNSHNTSSTQDNKMYLTTNNQTNTASSLSNHSHLENNTTSSNHSNQIVPYPPLRQMNNFHTSSTLPRQNHHSITPTPLRQNTTAASLDPIDGDRSSSRSASTPFVQHKKDTYYPFQTNNDTTSSSLHRTGGESIGDDGSAVVSSSQHFRPATPTPYPAINGAWNQNGNIVNHNAKSHLPSQSTDKPTQQARLTPSSPQNMDPEDHRSTPIPIANHISNTHAKTHSSPTTTPTDIPKKINKPSRPAVDPRYDPNLTLAQRLEASTDLPLAPFSEYEWKSENEYVSMTSWQPPEKHSEEWRQRDLEGWR